MGQVKEAEDYRKQYFNLKKTMAEMRRNFLKEIAMAKSQRQLKGPFSQKIAVQVF